MKDNTKIALTVKQKQLIADFKDLSKKMENENIGIVGELNYFSKWEKNYLYLQLFNKEEDQGSGHQRNDLPPRRKWTAP